MQASFDLDAVMVAPTPVAAPVSPPAKKETKRASSAWPEPLPGPVPQKIGDVFVCWVCRKERIATKATRVWWLQYGHEQGSGHLRLVVCSNACDKKHDYCINCGVYGHDRSDGPEVCKRYHAGPRNRTLKLYKCFAHRVIERHKSDVAQGWHPSSAYDSLAQLLMEHGGDFEKVREVISTMYVSPSDNDEFGNKLVRALEQVVRDDPDYGVEYHQDTPEQVVERARVSVARYRKDQARLGRQRVNDGHMSESDALKLLVVDEVVAKVATLHRAISAYGARASTPDAERVLVPLLTHEDSSVRSVTAWALFHHRTDEVRAAMLARAQVEDVPLLKAYLEQIGEQP